MLMNGGQFELYLLQSPFKSGNNCEFNGPDFCYIYIQADSHSVNVLNVFT